MQEEIILYTTHCPKCRVLESKLQKKGISYKEETDIEKMQSIGIKSVPMMNVNGKILDFFDSNTYINSL